MSRSVAFNYYWRQFEKWTNSIQTYYNSFIAWNRVCSVDSDAKVVLVGNFRKIPNEFSPSKTSSSVNFNSISSRHIIVHSTESFLFFLNYFVRFYYYFDAHIFIFLWICHFFLDLMQWSDALLCRKIFIWPRRFSFVWQCVFVSVTYIASYCMKSSAMWHLPTLSVKIVNYDENVTMNCAK